MPASIRSPVFPRCASSRTTAIASWSRCRRAICRSPRTRSTRSRSAPAPGTTRSTCGMPTSMFDVARLIGDSLREAKSRDGPFLMQSNIDSSRELPRRRPDPRRAAPALPRLQRRQLHRGDGGHLLLPERRDQVRQADHRPRDHAPRVAHRRDEVHDGLVRLHDALEHLGRPADRPSRLPGRFAARSECSGASTRTTPTTRWSTASGARGCARCSRSSRTPIGCDGHRVALQHRTTYRFDRNVGLGPHEIRLRPAPHCRTPILGYSLNVAPERYFLNWQQDPYGNWVARLVFTDRADELDIRVDLTADMTVVNPFDFFVDEYAQSRSVRVCAGTGEGADSVPRDRADRTAARRMARALPADDVAGRENRRHAGAAEPPVADRDQLPRPDGTGRAAARHHARARAGILPRHGVASGPDPAPPGPCGALRIGISDPAHGGLEAARRPRRAGARFHRPPRVGGGLSAGCRLDRPRSHVGSARRAKAIFRSRAPPTPATRRR